MTGSVNRLTRDRGFGFIRGDGHVYFFHRSALGGGLNFDELMEGQRVTFEPRQADKGPRATDVGPSNERT
jgi:cold shock CspA family protein